MNKTLLWLIIFIISTLIIYSINEVLTPFILSFLIAYLLNPLVTKMDRFKIKRSYSTMIILMVFFAIFISIIILVSPILYKQIISLITDLPVYIDNIYNKLLTYLDSKFINLSEETIYKFKQKITASSDGILSNTTSLTKSFLHSLFNSTLSIVNIIGLMLLTPVLCFYMLKDWDQIIYQINNLLPKKYKTTILEQIDNVNKVLSGYIRGQLNVCLILGIIYAAALSAIGLKYGITVGFLTGLFSFIPYVGVLFGFLVSLIIGYIQFDAELYKLILIALIFIISQTIEGNFITPNLIGNKVGLHPIWIMFGLLVGANLLGFTGILLSIPITAIVGVLVRFMIKQYKNSKLYN